MSFPTHVYRRIYISLFNYLLLGLHVVTVTSIAGPSRFPQLTAEIAIVTCPPTSSPVHRQGSSIEQIGGHSISLSDLDKLLDCAVSSLPWLYRGLIL